MAQPEVGPQERQEPPTHSLRIPVPGSRPGSTGALPVALSPLRGRTGAELRNQGLRALPLASALVQGRHRGALFHLGYTCQGFPVPPRTAVFPFFRPRTVSAFPQRKTSAP